jgi:hypothetical protein
VALEVNHTARKFDRQKWCHSRRATEQIKQPKDFLANKHLCLLDMLRKGISFSGGSAERWIAECGLYGSRGASSENISACTQNAPRRPYFQLKECAVVEKSVV